MDNLERAQRDWENPPDEEEAETCEFCGEELVYLTGYLKRTLGCANQYCPSEFSGSGQLVINMANHLAEVEQELRDLKLKLKSKQHVLDVISRLTPSQSKEVVRDTEYQITRMEDSLECLKECSDWDNFYEEFALVEKEWNEVKKILENG